MGKKYQESSPWIVWVVGALFFVGLVALIFWNYKSSPYLPKTSPDISKVSVAEVPFIGDANAKVTIAEWSDYQCPFCKQVDQTIISQVISDYVNTGKAKILFKDFQFLGKDSQTVGLAERAVWELAPDKFYEWRKAVYEKQGAENGGWASKANILAITKSVGIDSDKVDQLMNSKGSEYQKAIDADKTEGISFGVNSTPSFMIGTKLIVGAQSYDTFKSAIEAELNK